MKYDAEVASAIAQVDSTIDPALVHAIIQVESSHGAHLVTAESGGRYSYGPMMVLDTTATGYGVDDPTTLASNPALGIYYGVLYLDSKLANYPGDPNSAIAAYNSGTARYNADGTYINQAYVDRVLGYWQQYRTAGAALAGGAAGAGLLLAVAAGVFVFLRSRKGRAA